MSLIWRQHVSDPNHVCTTRNCQWKLLLLKERWCLQNVKLEDLANWNATFDSYILQKVKWKDYPEDEGSWEEDIYFRRDDFATGCIEGDDGHPPHSEGRRPHVPRRAPQLCQEPRPCPQPLQLQGWLQYKWYVYIGLIFPIQLPREDLINEKKCGPIAGTSNSTDLHGYWVDSLGNCLIWLAAVMNHEDWRFKFQNGSWHEKITRGVRV